jgi:rubrerythrin
MKVDFSGDQIKIYDFDELEAYRIARKIESDGMYYYSRMKDEVLKPEIRNAVEMLLNDERRHLDLFDQKVEELARKRKIVDEGETIEDIIDSKVLNVLKDTKQVADVLCDPQEAVRLGISVEKRSVAFYKEILQTTKDKTGKEALNNIIKEEQGHLKKLEGLLRK